MWKWLAALGAIVAVIAVCTGHWLVGLGLAALAVWLWQRDNQEQQQRRDRESGFPVSLLDFSASLPSLPSIDLD